MDSLETGRQSWHPEIDPQLSGSRWLSAQWPFFSCGASGKKIRRVIYRARSRVIEAINHTLGGSKAFHDYALIEDISFRDVSSFWAIPAEMHFRVNLHVKDARHQTAQRMASGVVKGWYDRSLHAVYGTVRMSVGSEAVSEHQFIYGSSEGVKHSAPDPRTVRQAAKQAAPPKNPSVEDSRTAPDPPDVPDVPDVPD